MKWVKRFRELNEKVDRIHESRQTESEVAEICRKYGIENWTLNSDGLVDVDGDVNLYGKGLTKLPLKFGHVSGFFDCDINNNLTSLKGAPHSISGDFWCQCNNIRSFEGLVNISGDFWCGENPVWEIWNVINPGTNKWDNEKMDFFNDLDIIRGEEIAIERFNFFLEEFGIDPVESVEGYKNIY